MREVQAYIELSETFAPAIPTATANGTGVDLKDAQDATVVIHAGDWTDGSFVFTIEESDDNSSFSTVAAGNLDGSLPTIDSEDEDDQIYKIGYKGTKRYIRLVSTVSGSPSTGLAFSAHVVVLNKRSRGSM